MAQRACTLTFKSSDASTHTLSLPANAIITPKQAIDQIRVQGGFWAGDTLFGQSADITGVAAGSVWVAWEQVVSVTIS